MTGLLKETFTEEAEAIGDPNLDLDAIVATGNRRIKRRRLGSMLTAAAASVAVVGGGLVAAQHFGSNEGAQVATGGPLTERRPTWASGKEIHFGTDVIRVPVAVASFVQTNAYFVFTSADGSVYRVSDIGSAGKIGKGSKTHQLAADAEHGIVGWVDATRPVPEFVLYDLEADREVARTAAGNQRASSRAESPRVAAIDDGIAYLAASDGLRRWTLATGVGELIKPKAAPNFLLAAEAGQLVWDNKAADDLAVGTDVNAPDPAHFDGWHASISPEARYLLTDKADTVGVVDLRSGKSAPVTIPGYTLIAPTQWKDDHTVYAVGFRDETSPLDLLTCTIKPPTSVACTPTLKDFAPPLTRASTTQFPNGAPANS
ncbi:hypothetical protein [Kribbella sp. NPDC051620]|uniref:hypothetical protein n=1 Tax=Kribbella sp. NPDC051620 TaxID=3364120 RepID=UPI00378E9443